MCNDHRRLGKSIPSWWRRKPVWLLAAILLSGCAAVTNPVANGIPARRLPEEFLWQPREEEVTIPLTLLRQKPPEVYRLASGDLLGVWVEGVLGKREDAPPVNYATQQSNLPPSLGYPIPVRENGTISLPLIDPIMVQGLSIPEVERAISNAYTVQRQILKPGRDRIIVTLMRPRMHHILVIRQDTGGLTVGGTGVIGNAKRGTGYVVDLPAYENDVLNALAKTGGMPGLEANNEVIIQRGYFSGKPGEAPDMQALADICRLGETSGAGQVVRIPLRTRPGEPPSFKPEDIILHSGDIVFIEARDTEVFYTAGLLPIGEHILPRDYDLDVVEAIARVSGPLVNGGFNANNFSSGTVVGGGIGSPSPSLVSIMRKTPGGGQVTIRVDLNRAMRDPRERLLVKPGDILVLQETLGEAFVRYFTQVVSFQFTGRAINRQDAQGVVNAAVP